MEDNTKEGWKIDTSAGSPILTYKGCSVIQDEQAYFVMALIIGRASRPCDLLPAQEDRRSRMKIVAYAGDVLEDGRIAVTFFWPKEWGPAGVPCVIDASGPAPHDEDAKDEGAVEMDSLYRQAREERIRLGVPMRAPASCPHCHDETDCECVAICCAVEQAS